MVLPNVSPNSLNADFHFVPTVHVPYTDRAAMQAYASNVAGRPTRSTKCTIIVDDAGPVHSSVLVARSVAAADGDLLKPDLIAPGQDILASVAPPGNIGWDFNRYSGTSMSSSARRGRRRAPEGASPEVVANDD